MFDQATGSIDSQHRGFFADAGDVRQVWAWSADEKRVVYLPEDGVDDAIRRGLPRGAPAVLDARLCRPALYRPRRGRRTPASFRAPRRAYAPRRGYGLAPRGRSDARRLGATTERQRHC